VNVAALNEHGAGNECLIYNPQGNFIQFAGNEAAACAAQQAYGPRLVNMWIPHLAITSGHATTPRHDTITIKLTDNITLKNILDIANTCTNNPTPTLARHSRYLNIR